MEDELKRFQEVLASESLAVQVQIPEKRSVVQTEDKITSKIDSSFLKGHFTGNVLFDNAKKVNVDQDAKVFEKMLEFLKNDNS